MNEAKTIKELKFDLLWYNFILFFWLLSLILKLIWIIKKYQTGEMLIWKIAILSSASLSFLCYFWMRRMKISKQLNKMVSKLNNRHESPKCPNRN